jgi:hypothetical protein
MFAPVARSEELESERLADAETALVMRARDLFYTSGDKIDEAESLDDAMCILDALRSSLKHRPTAVPGVGIGLLIAPARGEETRETSPKRFRS